MCEVCVHKFMTIAGLVAAGILIAASAAMNYLFASSLGRSWFEGQILGVVSIAVDCMKALLVVFLARASRFKRRAFVMIGGCAFVLFTITSFVAAAGFLAVNRGAVSASVEALNAQLVATERSLVTIAAAIIKLPQHRPVTVVTEALSRAEVVTASVAKRLVVMAALAILAEVMV